MNKPVGGWIEHDGKGMPVEVDGETLVEIKISIEGDAPIERGDPANASWFDRLDWWAAGAARVAITHYRVVEA